MWPLAWGTALPAGGCLQWPALLSSHASQHTRASRSLRAPRPLPRPRRNAVRVVLYTNLTAFMLLGHACDVLREQLQLQSSSSTLHTRAAERALAAMGGRGLVGAVAAAARGMAATVALVHSEAGQRELADPSNTTLADMFRLCLEQAACMATAVCKHVLLLAQAVKQRLPPPVQAARPGSLLAAPNIPPLVVQLAEALADSELLAAAATVLLDAPPVYKLQHLPDQGRNTFCRDLRNSVENAALSMYYMHNAIECIASLGGSEAQRLACGLLRAMRHVAVRRLQVGLLDRLAAHAGMVAALSEGREEQEGSGLQAGQAGEGQQAESERGGWEGSSGAWWFAREEARRGRLLGKDPAGGGGGQARSRATGAPQEVQEGHHHCVLSATFGEWLWVQRDQVTVAVA